jgi:periplasmic copper chaperone A
MNPSCTTRLPAAMRPVTTLGRAAVLAIGALLGVTALAHDYRAGDVRIIHPYATPSIAGMHSGAAYVATLENTGSKPDRLLRATSPQAGRVELHSMSVDTGGVMRMREQDSIRVEPGSPIKMKPGQGLHFMLMDLEGGPDVPDDAGVRARRQGRSQGRCSSAQAAPG